MTIRKINLMYKFFGEGEEMCGDCSHFHKGLYRGKTYRKCDVYGMTHGEATDWSKHYMSCGLFNKEYNGRNIVDFVTPERETDNEPLEGQIDLLGGDAE